MRLHFQYLGSIYWASKTVKRKWNNKYTFFSQILFRMLESFENKAAVVRDDTPERSFQVGLAEDVNEPSGEEKIKQK